MCEMYHTLPRPGGALAQHPNEIRKLLKVQEIIDKHREDELERKKNQ